MSDPKQGLFRPREGRMNAATALDGLRQIEGSLVTREQARNGGSRIEARQRVASKAGIAAGTLYNLARDRLKRADQVLRERLTAYAVKDLEAEIRRLENDLVMARALGASQNEATVRQISEVLTRAIALHRNAVGAGFAELFKDEGEGA